MTSKILYLRKGLRAAAGELRALQYLPSYVPGVAEPQCDLENAQSSMFGLLVRPNTSSKEVLTKPACN